MSLLMAASKGSGAVAKTNTPVSATAPADTTDLVFWFEAQFLVGLNDGDAIVQLTDHHTTANHATQATAGKRALYKPAQTLFNAKPIARFAQASGKFYQLPAINYGASTALTMMAVLSCTAGGAENHSIFEINTNATNPWFQVVRTNTDTLSMGTNGNAGFATFAPDAALTAVTTNPALIVGVNDKTLSSSEAKLYVHGMLKGTSSFDTNNSDAYGTQTGYIGIHTDGATQAANMDLAALLVFKNALSAQRLHDWQRYLGLVYGVAYLPDAADLSENAYSTFGANYIRSSPIARAVFTGVDATSVLVETYSDLFAVQPTNSEIGVRVNGADHATVASSAAQTIASQSLPAGANKTVEIIAGAQASPSGTVLGTFLKSIRFPGDDAVLTTVTSTGLIVTYGDSITSGAAATNIPLEAWPALVRDAYVGTLRNEAWGSRALFDDANGLRGGTANLDALAALLTTGGLTKLWLAIGTNDYGLDYWANLAAVQTAYGSLLDKVHALAPSAAIWCQSPLQRIAPAAEIARAAGFTLGQLRTAIQTEAGSRSTFCTYVNGGGAAIVSNANMDPDGIHLTTTGQAQYATFVKTTLGIP